MTRRVTLVRTGGVAGVRIEKSVDAGELSAGETAAIEGCLAAAPGAKAGAPTRAPDRFCYTLTVEDGGTRRSTSFREGEEPAALRPLIAALGGPKEKR